MTNDPGNEFVTIKYEVHDGLARLTLNRPDRLNAMSHQLIDEVHTVLQRAAIDETIRVLVLTGAGRGFSPGGEAAQFGSAPEPQLQRHHYQISTLLHDLPAVTVAAVNGACAGAGLAWALACDLRIIADSAKFNTAFLDVAVAGDMGLPWFLLRQVGAAAARELCFLPGKFDAQEARALGIARTVVPDVDFTTTVESTVARLLSFSPTALKVMKANILAAEGMAVRPFIELETERHESIRNSPEVVAAFRSRFQVAAADAAHE